MENLRFTKTFCVLFALSLASIFVVFTGCQKAQGLKGLVKVKGTVTLDGSPLSGASVTFVPLSVSDELRGASGTSDDSGNFEMTTLNKADGVMPGEYRVTVVKREATGKVPTPEEMQEASLKGISLNIQYKSVIPDKYGSSSTSGLSAKIEPNQKDPVKFELTSR